MADFVGWISPPYFSKYGVASGNLDAYALAPARPFHFADCVFARLVIV
jgi:hypothetical protein